MNTARQEAADAALKHKDELKKLAADAHQATVKLEQAKQKAIDEVRQTLLKDQSDKLEA